MPKVQWTVPPMMVARNLHASGNRCMNRWPTRQTTPRTQVRCRFSSGALRTWELHIYVTSSRHSNLDRIPTQPPPFVPCICPASVMAMGIRYVPPRRPRPANAPRSKRAGDVHQVRTHASPLLAQPATRPHHPENTWRGRRIAPAITCDRHVAQGTKAHLRP